MEINNNIPQATAKRLPLYYRFLNNLHLQGKTRVSSKELSEAVKVDSATIRRDFSYFGALGRKGYGYNVEYLLEFFRKTLNQDNESNVALIGVGNLGTAFLHYNFSKSNNTKIAKAYDANPDLIGKEVGHVMVEDVEKLDQSLSESDIDVAILTVPGHVAQSVTDVIVKVGVKGILNFTPARLTVPADVRVHHIDLTVELQSLLYFVEHYPLEKK